MAKYAKEVICRDFGITEDMSVGDFLAGLKEKWKPGGKADLAQRERIANGEGG